MKNYSYCHSLTQYKRRKTIEVKIGNVSLGGDNPIRVQSMTTCDTMDTDCTVKQSIRMVEAGCEYVRITAPGIKEAKNLKLIKQQLLSQGINTPLVADIHYTPNAALEAAKHVEKVRINPGNYADKKKFETLEYTDATYQEEINRIEKKFIPLIQQCKKYNTALRIGTNHGSLSDRILSRYGDTPMGMVESALEFVRICEAQKFYTIVLSMKASNTRVMVQAYRLLVNKLEEEGLQPYPLHLGVTEAGDGEDGRIKSSVGIGSLMEDGLGDTIRVSLTEDPELEMPVAAAMVRRYNNHKQELPTVPVYSKNPFEYAARETHLVLNFGGNTSPRVIANFAKQEVKNIESLHSIGYRYIQATDKWISLDTAADYIYLGKNELKIELPSGLKAILDSSIWNNNTSATNSYPIFTLNEYKQATLRHPKLNFLAIQLPLIDELPSLDSKTVLVLNTNVEHSMPVYRQFILGLMQQSITAPVVMAQTYGSIEADDFQLFAATDMGGVLIDGLGNGIMLKYASDTCNYNELANNTAFGILQAARTRMSKTEYISCPSCGRTLFDLQLTTAKIKEQTDHLKGVKIGIMGCIVNGPGEMADADYGYVGAGIEKISLYKGQEVVQKGLKPEVAVDALIQLIKDDGRWVEPEEPMFN
ncbi:MAG: (E)-4-hydroxy-3-methylbut-2-enyl-diphosphate synthase [Cyclobacteriaceae bacterium]|nr:(E)-4-hydroxy-3-methylbut-2-enyl-diphosphate synthase [Cyclobacteriaceae bacterium]